MIVKGAEVYLATAGNLKRHTYSYKSSFIVGHKTMNWILGTRWQVKQRGPSVGCFGAGLPCAVADACSQDRNIVRHESTSDLCHMIPDTCTKRSRPEQCKSIE